MTIVVTTTEGGVLCGISFKWGSEDKWFADPEALLFDEMGPHSALKANFTVGCFADYGSVMG